MDKGRETERERSGEERRRLKKKRAHENTHSGARVLMSFSRTLLPQAPPSTSVPRLPLGAF